MALAGHGIVTLVLNNLRHVQTAIPGTWSHCCVGDVSPQSSDAGASSAAAAASAAASSSSMASLRDPEIIALTLGLHLGVEGR